MNKHEFISSIKGTGQFRTFLDLISTKQYDKIYEYYGKTVYALFASHSHKKKDINKLMEQKRYGEIYSKYGVLDIMSIKKLNEKSSEEIKKMISEGKFEDIYRKYGYEKYNIYCIKFYDRDISNEVTDNSDFKLYRNKFRCMTNLIFLKKITLTPILIALISYSSIDFIAKPVIINDQMYEYNLAKYSEEINIYNSKITEYADYINSLELTDLQIIMKVMNDTLSDMSSFGEPELDVRFFERLDLLNPNGVGVCRNIADDFTAKMNAINPEYNARNVIVYFDVEQVGDEIENNLEIYLGNHMVTILQPRDCSYSIMVDSTNFSIGVLMNGKIHMFLKGEEDLLSYRIVGQFKFTRPDTFYEVNRKVISSFLNPISENELAEAEKRFGNLAQIDALNYVKYLTDGKYK